ncbi:suppressor of fused domain protein [Antribacter gilvus]|uniref:suppressor of fused domain protein n=1 Tax=Antribacter gilvus TaxID=2304675 RepID=UPI000F79DF65|nr:suppressor of fused domain protein [Antribacter gilvus]
MDEAPGWTAIDAALTQIYGRTPPQHWATLLSWRLGGPDPLDGVSAYAREMPVPHWHYVTYGFSELSENAEESGWGFELTFRLTRSADETEAPVWPANLLQNLARYVFGSGNGFGQGHYIDANGPIAADRPDSQVRALAFTEDPELRTIATPHGRVVFLQVVGLTSEEHATAATAGDAAAILDLLATRYPLLITDIDRSSLLATS